MRSSMKVFVGVAVIAGVVLLVVWLRPRPSNPNVSPSGETTGNPSVPEKTDSVVIAPTPPIRTSTPAHVEPGRTNRAQPSVAPGGTNEVAEWEDKLDNILGGEGEEPQKAKQLLELFPRVPEDGQVELAQHLSNLVADQDYAALGKLLADASQPEAVLDVLLGDLLNRPNAIKLPELLEIARNAQHPKAEEAKDLLELYLEEDYGADWSKWQAKMEQWIKANPD